MVRVKRPTGSKTSQRVNKDNNPSICLTSVDSEVEKHRKGNTHASCNDINGNLEERCSEYCLSLSTSDDYPVVGVDFSKDIETDQLNKPCDGETNIIFSNLSSTTFSNFVMDMKPSSPKRIECRRKGSLSIEEPLQTYYRKKKGFLKSLKPLKTYRRRRNGYLSLGISQLLTQNSSEAKVEDLVHPVQKTMHCVDINMWQKQMTATDGESSNNAGDKVLENDRKGQSHVNHIAAEFEDFRSPVLPGSTRVTFTEEVSDIAPQEQSMELDPCEKPDIIVDETCDVLFGGNNLNKLTNDIENGASLVERKQDNVEEASLDSSETMKQHIITQSITAVSKISPQGAPSGSIKRKLLVLDINGLLADIVSAEHVSHENGPVPDTIIARKRVFKRPFCDEFLEFCFERFSVGVWSSRTKKNVDLVLDFLMGEKRQNLLFCWDQSQCTYTRFNTPENKEKPLFFKRMNKLWENFGNDLPWKRGDYDESNTLLLDDSPYKALLNPPNTAIFPCTYQFSDEGDNALGPDGDLRIYLDGLSMALNVQEYVKQNPYGQDPITENHASWSFYHEVIKSTVVDSSRNSHQSLVSTEKLWKDVSKVNSISVAESSIECLDNNGTLQQRETAKPNGLLTENADDNSTGSPGSIQRGCKRGRGARSQSPRHEISGSQSRSLSPKKCRRSKSPAPSHESGFGCDKARSYQTLHSECRNFTQGRCLRGTSCRFVHHQSLHKSYVDRRVQQHDGQIFEHKHVPRECYEFIQGKCKYGVSCRFLHSIPDKAGPRMEGNETSRQQSDNVRSDKAAPGQCNNFVQGKCNYGSSCRFLHSIPDKADLSTEGNETDGKQFDNVRSDKAAPRECYEFIQGKCKYGVSCRFLHSVPDKAGIGMEGNEIRRKQLDNVRSDKAAPGKCYDFVQGRCNYGASCRFLHSIPDKADFGSERNEIHGKQLDTIRRDEVVNRECNDFMRGKCNYGASCRFLHSVPDQADLSTEGNETNGKHFDNVSNDNALPRECSDFIHGSCHQGASCRFPHSGPDKADLGSERNETHGKQLDVITRDRVVTRECNDFMRGKCNYGASCRYLHSVPGKTDRLNSFHYRHYQDVHSSANKSGDSGKAQSSSFNEYGKYKATPEVCRNYTQGRCSRGSYCSYVHQKSGITVGSGSTSQLGDTGKYKAVREVCWDYLQGRCHKGTDCLYLHQEPGLTSGSSSTSQHLNMRRYKANREVCRNYTLGRCHKGSDCAYMHQEPDLTSSGSTSQLGETSGYKSLREVCRHYAQGRCHKELDCRFLHPEPGLSVGSGATSQVGETRRFNAVNEVCRNHTQGRCSKGLQCRYLHQELVPASGFGCTAHFGQTSRYEAPKEVCRNYSQGRCQKGSYCRYLHQESGVTVGSGSINTRRFKALPEVCRNFTQGRCHKGPDCWYLHQEPGDCNSPQQSFSHQTATSSTPWNTKLPPGQCADYTRGTCWRGERCRLMHHEDVSSNPKSFGSCGDLESIHHETSVHEHTDSRTQESVPQFSGVDEKEGTVEALPNQPIVPDDDANHIKDLENEVAVFMANLGDSDHMKVDVNNNCHESSVHDTAEPGTDELIADFHVVEEQRGIMEPLASHPTDGDGSGKASVVPEVDSQDERVPEKVICAPLTDNLGNSDRIVQVSDNQLEQMSNS